MAHDAIAAELDTFAQFPRAFTFAEISDFADSELPRSDLLAAVHNDARFVQLNERGEREGLFVPRTALFRCFTGLTLRLAQAKKSRLSGDHLARVLSSLRLEGRWLNPPVVAVEFGEGFGFVGPAWKAGEYVFPMAHVLSFVLPLLTKEARSCLEGMTATRDQPLSLTKVLENAVQEGLSAFDKRVVGVVQAREGLGGEKALTLEQLGKSLGITRERVRQLEAKFWTNISEREKLTCPFLYALLRLVMAGRGSLTFAFQSREESLIRFAAKCLGVPIAEVPDARLAILGNANAVVLPKSFPQNADKPWIVRQLGSNEGLPLIRDDIVTIAERVVRYRLSHLNKSQMVYLALRQFGRPAHYSMIAKAYESMFPAQSTTEHAVHAILNREEHGVVWIGIRGTFALKEWGYEHPSQGLFEAVAEIVTRRYTETGIAVPFGVIMAEVGKYRQMVKPSSLTFAAHYNPALQRVGKDSFVPKEPSDEDEEEIPPEELDRVLREFEEEKVSKPQGTSP